MFVRYGCKTEKEKNASENYRVVCAEYNCSKKGDVSKCEPRRGVAAGWIGPVVPESSIPWKNFLKSKAAATVLIAIAIMAFQPNSVSMYTVPQFHGRATIRTGGAAKWVRTPPIDTFTNSTATVT